MSDELFQSVKVGLEQMGIEGVEDAETLRALLSPVRGESDVDDMEISVTCSGGKYGGQELKYSAWVVKKVSEKFEDKLKKVKNVDGVEMYESNIRFAIAVSNELESLGMPCTPAIAESIWIKANEFIFQVQKKTKLKQTLPTGTESTPTS